MNPSKALRLIRDMNKTRAEEAPPFSSIRRSYTTNASKDRNPLVVQYALDNPSASKYDIATHFDIHPESVRQILKSAGVKLTRKQRISGYTKTRGPAKQSLYNQIAQFALDNPLSTLNEIAKANNVSSNTVWSVLKEFNIRKAEQRIGNRRVPWIRLEDLMNKPVPASLGESQFVPNPTGEL